MIKRLFGCLVVKSCSRVCFSPAAFVCDDFARELPRYVFFGLLFSRDWACVIGMHKKARLFFVQIGFVGASFVAEVDV